MVEHLLAIDDVDEDFEGILKWAIEFKRLWKQGDDVALNFLPLDTLAIGSIYEKPSTRTRVSFEVGVQRLGGSALTLLKNDIQLGKSETVGDTSQVLSRFLGGMTYRCFAHADVEELAKHATVPVINALSAKHHPCQAAADLMTVMEHHDDTEGLTVAWVVVSMVQVIGALLVTALLVTPAATGQLVGKSFRGCMMWTQAFGLASTLLGLFLSAELNTGSGSMIALVAAVLFATVGLLKLVSSQLPAYDASPESEEAQG